MGVSLCNTGESGYAKTDLQLLHDASLPQEVAVVLENLCHKALLRLVGLKKKDFPLLISLKDGESGVSTDVLHGLETRGCLIELVRRGTNVRPQGAQKVQQQEG